MYIINEKYKDKYINFDITTIIKEWFNNNNNFGLTLYTLSEEGVVFFQSDNGEKKPYIRISYVEEHIENPKGEYSFNDQCLRCKKCYGMIINDKGNFIRERKLSFIEWDKIENFKGVKIDSKNKRNIIIKELGVYQIDYGVNLRSSEFTFMELIMNCKEIEYTKIQVGLDEHMNNGSTIIKIDKEDSTINLAIRTTEMILTNVGIAAYLRIIKIN